MIVRAYETHIQVQRAQSSPDITHDYLIDHLSEL